MGWRIRMVLTMKTETLLTRLGLWEALQGFPALLAASIGSVALSGFLTPRMARLFAPVALNVLYVVGVGLGLLLGLIGHFAGDLWDRAVFEASYGPRGRWRDAVQTCRGSWRDGDQRDEHDDGTALWFAKTPSVLTLSP